VSIFCSKITGKTIRFQPLTDEQCNAALVAAGLPPFVAAISVSFGRAAREGHLGIVTGLVKRYLGRTPTSVAEFLASNRAAFAS
jgi:NAD(P)H dehydrogenase (quinone)